MPPGNFECATSAWSIFDDIMIVLKSGGIEYPDLTPPDRGDRYFWFAYLLGSGNSSGTWTYPYEKEISHLSIYGRIGESVPEPRTMLLFGIAIAGLAGLRSRRNK